MAWACMGWACMAGLLDGLAETVRRERGRRRRCRLLIDGLMDLDVRQAGQPGLPHGVAEALPGLVLEADLANDIGAGDDFHPAAGMLLEHPGPLQVGIGAGHHLRIGQKLLREGPVIRQGRSGRQIPRRHVPHDLVRDLLVNRRRRIVLNVDHANSRCYPPLRRSAR